jgi:hypothetical protein
MRPLLIATTPVCAALLLACCSSASPAGRATPPDGTITGRILIEGGPPGLPVVRPVAGTVEFTRGHGQVTATATAGPAGTFSASLPAGTYQVSARSPHLLEGTGGVSHQSPFGQTTVTVTARHATRVTLTAIVP